VIRMNKIPCAAFAVALVSICGCGDMVDTRKLSITEMRGYSEGWGPLELDASRAPVVGGVHRVERRNWLGQPVTEVRFTATQPVKLLLVPATQPSGRPIYEQQALAIARKAVEANDTWADRATYEARLIEPGWTVTVWRQPTVPGGFRIVTIDSNGKVTNYYRGH
jgi:hypothetical protein